MRVIDAYWEKRNIGMPAAEVIFDDADADLDYSFFLAEMNKVKNDYAYYAVKIPTGCYKLIDFANKYSLSFIECQIRYAIYLKTVKLLGERGVRIDSSFSIELVSDKDSYDYVTNEIKKGIFNTDRIALDKRFGLEISNTRYANWLNDMFGKEESRLYIVYHNGLPFGFHAGSEVSGIYRGNFGGLFVDYQNSMLGMYWSSVFLNSIQNVYKKVVFSCSTNNIQVIKLWHIFRPTIESVHYVFTN